MSVGNRITLAVAFVATFSCFVLASSARAAEMEHSGFLTSYDMLKPGPEGGVALRWQNPAYSFPEKLAEYSAFYIDPITVYLSEEGKDRGVPVGDLNVLAIAFHAKLVDAIKDKYQIAQQPGPGVLPGESLLNFICL